MGYSVEGCIIQGNRIKNTKAEIAQYLAKIISLFLPLYSPIRHMIFIINDNKFAVKPIMFSLTLKSAKK